jgi:hypothetical protein
MRILDCRLPARALLAAGGGPEASHVSGKRRRGLSLVFAVTLVALGAVATLHAEEARPLPAPQQVPVHSRVDVSTLPPPNRGKGSTLKPFRPRDPDGLERRKQQLDRSPALVPTALGVVPDKRSDP